MIVSCKLHRFSTLSYSSARFFFNHGLDIHGATQQQEQCTQRLAHCSLAAPHSRSSLTASLIVITGKMFCRFRNWRLRSLNPRASDTVATFHASTSSRSSSATVLHAVIKDPWLDLRAPFSRCHVLSPRLTPWLFPRVEGPRGFHDGVIYILR